METKKIVALGATAGVVIGAVAGGAVGFVSQQDTISDLIAAKAVLAEQIKELKSQEPVVVTEYVNQTVEVPVEVPVEIMVDNGNLSFVLEHIFDNEGNVTYLTEDLDEDELDLIVERIVFMNESKGLALAYVEAELFDELDGESVNLSDNSTMELDEDDMERLRLDSEQDEVSIEEVDFEDRDAVLVVTGRFEQDDTELEFVARVRIKDGVADEILSVEVQEE